MQEQKDQEDPHTQSTCIKEGITYGDEFLVFSIFAIFSENAKKGLLAVKGLANFVQSFHKT